jgi:lysophospholipase L1-like esterase
MSERFLGAAIMVTAAFVGCGGTSSTPFGDNGNGTVDSGRSGSSTGGTVGTSTSSGSSGGAASSGSGSGSGASSGGGASSSGATPDGGATSSGGSSGGASSSGGADAGASDGGRGDGGSTGTPDASRTDGGRGTDSGTTGPDGSTTFQNTTIWIAGDSTVSTHNAASATSVESWGWGGQFNPLFNTYVTVTDSAIAGRSVRTWLYTVGATADATGECILTLDAMGNPVLQGHWTAMLNGMKSGDYLFIQFGINDSDATCPRHVGSAAFKAAYGMMAQAAQARGANPVFVTPVNGLNGCNWTSNRGFLTETKDAGTQYGVPVIDLNARSIAYFQSLGCTAATAIFADGRTHFTQAGATAIAQLVAQGVRDLGLPLGAYLK